MTVGRLCRIRSGAVGDELPFPLDQDGFLDLAAAGPRGARDDDPSGWLVPLRDALRSGAVVLLGEPGLGKSTEFEALGKSGQPAGDIGRIIEVDGAEITDTATFDEIVGRYLRSLPARATTAEALRSASDVGDAAAADRTILIIDQVDESPILQQLAGHFRRSLDGRDISTLHLVLGCRTADYPSNLTAVLTNMFGSCVLADLAPLTRSEATKLASSAKGVDGNALIAAAVESGAGALASVPLTLELLVRTFRQRGNLDASPVDLFASGVRQLVEEHDPSRATADDESTAGQRLAVAERIAARLVLSGRRTIWRGPALRSGDHDLDVDALVGGEETWDGGVFDVTKKMIAATLATALFTGRGANRLAFRHGSFAAYLAARYLLRHHVPPTQLQVLFLISAGGTARTVPTPLRETAAWLVTLDETNTRWLVEADPESLVPHSPLVDSPSVRSLIVDAMLKRAPEIEAGDQPWARASRHLTHPNLDAQLLAVLEESGTGQPPDEQAAARIRLAVRLAREARSVELVDRLLQLAEHDQWDSATRVLAARAAFEIEPDRSAHRLRTILERLADRDLARVIDPYDELSGSLLRLLWPQHLPTPDVLPFLNWPGRPMFFGAYRWFRREFAEQLPDSDIDVVLHWAAQLLNPNADHQALETAPLADTNDDAHERLPEALYDLFDQVVERALSTPSAHHRLDAVAAILYGRLLRQDRPAIPRPINLVDADREEPDDIRSLRHAVAAALIERGLEDRSFNRATAWRLLGQWSSRPSWHLSTVARNAPGGLRESKRRALLDSHDFPWLFQLTAEADAAGRTKLAEAFAVSAAWLFDLAHEESASLAFGNQSHPVWRHVAWWFEPMPIDSNLAKQWREIHNADDDPGASPEDIARFHQEIHKLFADAVAGDPRAFWILTRLLQFDPETAMGSPRFDDDLLAYPGTALLPEDHANLLTHAALQYVMKEHDHADEWLEQGLRDKRARAGYLALALLHRRGRLDEIPKGRWEFWVSAIVSFDAVPSETGNAEIKRQLLAYAVQHAPQQLAEAVKVYVRSEIRHGNLAAEVELIDPGVARQLTDAWLELVADLSAAITGAAGARLVLASDQGRAVAVTRWEQMLSALIALPDARAVDQAIESLAASDDRQQLMLSGRAGSILLRSDAPKYLPTILGAATSSPPVGREIALATAQSFDARSVLDALAVPELASVYRWLSGIFPPTDDPGWRPGFQFTTPEQQAREWRDRTLEALVNTGTTEAVDALAWLHDEYPDRPILLYSLVRCRTLAARDGWKAPQPADVAQFLDDAARRFARSEAELCDVLLETLDTIVADLTGHSDLLWNRIPKRYMPKDLQADDGWCPKLEYALQEYLMHELNLRLTRRGIIINREVLVRPTDPTTGAGDQADILVETASRLNTMR